MNVSLPKGLEDFVREQVESGLYDSCSEVHRDGLRLLKAKKERDQAKLEELKRLLEAGARQLRNGEGVPFDVEDIIQLGKERYEALKRNEGK